MYDHPFSKEIGKASNIFPITNGIIEGFGKGAGDKNGKVGILCSFFRITVAIDRHNFIDGFCDPPLRMDSYRMSGACHQRFSNNRSILPRKRDRLVFGE